MNALIPVAALILVIAIGWFILAAVAEIIPSARIRARWHVKTAAKTAGISFASIIALAILFPSPPSSPPDEAMTEVTASTEDEAADDTAAVETADLGVSTGEIARPTSRPTLASDPSPEPELAPATRSRPRDAIDNAGLLCRLLDSSGETSAPCEYSAWHSTITLSASMLPGQARDLCNQIASLSGQMAMGLSRWTLHIKSPYSGDNSIAFCRLA